MTDLEKQRLLKEVSDLDLEFTRLNQLRMNSQHDYWADVVNIRNRQAAILKKIKEG